VGSGLPIAAGLALADRMQHRPAITACFFGDGAVAEGEFHESLNLAALWKLPVLFLCENNLYAMGTHVERHQARADIAGKAEAYGMPGDRVDGMDVLAVRDAAGRAAAAVRRDGTPYLLELRTYRFRAHSMYDPDLYRTKDEVARWRERDPISLFTRHLRDRGVLSGEDLAVIERDVATDIAAAVAYAEAAPLEPAEDLLRDVYTVAE
jgi:TPP-dependent pyruvate/acetoin dehydrogenase alpha subunit